MNKKSNIFIASFYKKGCLLCLKGLKYRRNFAIFFLIFTLLG